MKRFNVKTTPANLVSIGAALGPNPVARLLGIPLTPPLRSRAAAEAAGS